MLHAHPVNEEMEIEENYFICYILCSCKIQLSCSIHANNQTLSDNAKIISKTN